MNCQRPQGDAILQVGEHEVHALMRRHETRHVTGRIAQHPGLAGSGILYHGDITAPVALEQPTATCLDDLQTLVAIEVDTQRSRGIRHVAVEDPPEHGARILIEDERSDSRPRPVLHETPPGPRTRTPSSNLTGARESAPQSERAVATAR